MKTHSVFNIPDEKLIRLALFDSTIRLVFLFARIKFNTVPNKRRNYVKIIDNYRAALKVKFVIDLLRFFLKYIYILNACNFIETNKFELFSGNF